MIKNNQKVDSKNYDFSKIDKKVEKIIKDVCIYIKNSNKEYIEEQINKAYLYAKDAHKWQKRLSWEPYITHPVSSTEILLSLKPDILTIQACLLHDVIEDTPRTSDDIKKAFWKEVSFLCSWLEKLSKVRYKWEERSIKNLRKMFIAMAEDLRVVFIKLADRLHNMKTLKFHPKPEKRKRIALETLNIFSPIADRLWLYSLKIALNWECLKILEPEEYKKIKKELEELEDNKKIFVKNIKEEVDSLLKWKINNYEIDFRVKSIYSIYRKLKRKELDRVKDLYDLFGIRIMVHDISDCYKILWLIHNKRTPIPKRFKDYMALPKPNWYKSLHTTVMWLFKEYRKQPTEIQIKTFKMKEDSDLWAAAHFVYKENWSIRATDTDWVKELKELAQNIGDSDFVGSLKVDTFKNRIFVFTPKWDFINLPAKSTPIDFAYYIHTDLWNHITLAKVNNKIYPLDQELYNWDIVDIMIDKNKKPNPFRMSFVKTLKAKNNIKSFLKKEDKELYVERWKNIMNNYLKKIWLEKFDKDFSLLKSLDDREYNLESRLWLLEQIWNFSITPLSLLKKILKVRNIRPTKDNIKNLNKQTAIKNDVTSKKSIKWWNIVIGWESDMDYVLWPCIDTTTSDEIVAHINNKWIITIHTRDCDVLKDVNKDRLLPAYIKWTEHKKLMINLTLKFKKNLWILKDLSEIIYFMNIDIDEISTKKNEEQNMEIYLKLIILSYNYLMIDKLLEKLKERFKDNLIDLKLGKLWKTPLLW
jgi:GTP diphosphokinase / guanosine-3',5'-bis(diphosphate) 3'-diphosphatase